jgi:N-acylneuraminate cytidylyltransferase
MIAQTISAAIESGCFDRILVSTDDPTIAEVSRSCGAEVPFLRMDKADDFSPVSEATLCALAQAEAHWNESYETVVQLMANCPLRRADDILRAVSAFNSRAARFQISSFKFGWMNPWWSVKLDEDGIPQRLFAATGSRRSQDLETLYCPTGAIWIADSAALKREGTFYGEGHVFENMHWTSAVDIDDYEDLKMARAVYIMRREEDAS